MIGRFASDGSFLCSLRIFQCVLNRKPRVFSQITRQFTPVPEEEGATHSVTLPCVYYFCLPCVFPGCQTVFFVYAFCPIPFQRNRSFLNPGNCPCSFAKARSDNQMMQYAGKKNRFLTLWTVRNAEQRYRISIPCSSKRSCMA